jgi:hypothetical protein
MRRHCAAWSGLLFGLAVATPGLRAAPPPDKASADVVALAARIDKFIDDRLAEDKVPAAPLADDAEFLRRAYLDLTGRIPVVSEVHAFLRDKSPDKRLKLIEALLREPNHINHFTNVWRADLLTAANAQQAAVFGQQLEPWLRKNLRENVPYDEMVRDLLTTPVAGNPNIRVIGQPAQPGTPSAAAFFQANELKSENLAASTSKLFLGVQLQCAQCHNHPFAKWKREQFWEYAAFFAGVQPPQRGMPPVGPPFDPSDKREIKIPDTDTTVQAKFLDGTAPKWEKDLPTRGTLALWLTAAENPYFARARVNRVWAHLFGLGLVEPVDDLSEDNHPSHPEVLDELSRAFVKNKFDNHFLIRVICATKAYQRTSAVNDPGQVDNPRLFARMSLKGMTAEQLFESVARATGFVPPNRADDPREFQDYTAGRQEFLARFATISDRRTEHQTTILQALSLMNGRVIDKVTNLERSRTLAAVIDGPFTDDRSRLDALFMATLSRPMRPEEATRYTKYVQDGGPSGDSKKALADVFWALLNSTEFALNH